MTTLEINNLSIFPSDLASVVISWSQSLGITENHSHKLYSHFIKMQIKFRSKGHCRFKLVDFKSGTVEQTGFVNSLLPVDRLEVVPEYLSLQTLVRNAATVGDGVGPVLQGDDALLLDLAVFGAGVDAVDDDPSSLLVELSLEDPGVDIDRHLGDGVGTVGPALTLPTPGLGQTLELSHQPVCNYRKLRS